METYLLIGAAILAGLVVALRRIAPLTKSTADDKVLATLEPVSKAADDLIVKKERKLRSAFGPWSSD
jgi:hypothetical protein